MKREIIFSVSIVLLITFCFAQLPTDLLNGYYEGRSGDIIIYEKTRVQEDSSLIFLNKEIDSLDRVSETEVSNLLSHLLHSVPLTPDLPRQNYPQVNYFSQPKANLLFIFNSLYGKEHIEGSLILVTPESYPGDSLSKINSILSGRTPNSHAIVSDYWFDSISEKTVGAYSTWNPAYSGAAVASIQDLAAVTSHKSEEVALLFSISTSMSLARSLSPKEFVLAPSGLNTSDNLPTGLYWDENVFESVYEDEGNSALGRIIRKLMTKEKIKILVKEKLACVEFEEDGMFVWKNADGVHARFEGKNDFNAVVEMAMMEILAENAEELFAEKIKNRNYYYNKVDYYSIGFWSLGWIESRYGRESIQMKVAFNAIADAALKFTQKLEQFYDGLILEEMLFVANNNNNAAAASSRVKQIKEIIKKNIPRSHVSKKYSVDRFYPNLYLNPLGDNSDPIASSDYCVMISDNLQLEFDLKFSEGEVQALCVASSSSNKLLKRQTSSSVPAAGSSGAGASDGSNSDDAEAGTFQIALWVTVALFIAFGLGSMVMLTVDASTDSLLYAYDINHPNVGKGMNAANQ